MDPGSPLQFNWNDNYRNILEATSEKLILRHSEPSEESLLKTNLRYFAPAGWQVTQYDNR